MQAYDPATNPLNNNEWSFPLIECIHIAMFAFSVGTIAIVDLRLLGLGMKKQTTAQLTRDMSLLTITGLFLVIVSGMLLFTTDPYRYYYNPAFRFKIAALALAILFHYTVHRKVAMSKPAPMIAAVTAIISMLLWVSVVFGGLFYAFD